MRAVCALSALLLLAACDIQPVAVGIWEIETEAGGAVESAVWTITEAPSLTIAGPRTIEAEEVEFSGSRLSWSYSASPVESLSAENRVNFNGTVDGNRLSGTLFTQLGNFTVTGTRRQ